MSSPVIADERVPCPEPPAWTKHVGRLHRRLHGTNWSLTVPGFALLMLGGLLMTLESTDPLRTVLEWFSPALLDMLGPKRPSDASTAKVFGFLLVGCGVFLVKLVQKCGARNAAQRLSKDPRPRLLYIRAFADDGRVVNRTPRWLKQFNLAGWIGERGFEETLAWLLAPLGCLVAIAKPEERLPHIGAVRVKPDQYQNWRDKFKQLHSECAAVVVQAGRGAGLMWELEYVFAGHAHDAHRFKPILLCFPEQRPNGPSAEDTYHLFRSECPTMRRLALPPRLDKACFVWCHSPREGAALQPMPRSLKQFGLDYNLAGFSGVYSTFDEVVPGIGPVIDDYLDRGNRQAKWVYAFFILLAIVMIVSVLFG